jgi:hypothetical protein
MSLLCVAHQLADPDPVYSPGNGVSRPRPVFNPEPDLSKEPKRDKYKGGYLVAKITIRPDSSIHGNQVYARIREAEVLRSLGDADLDAKVIEDIRRTWIFEPCLKDQKPVSCKINVEITVHIQ